MKKSLLLLIFLLFSANLLAQKPTKSLLESNRNSYYAYIYRLTDAQAEFVCKNQYNKVEIKNLGQPVDSFIAKQDIDAQNTNNQRYNYRRNRYEDAEFAENPYTKKLPLGNYLRVFTQDNQVMMVYMSVSNILVDLVLNDRDLKIAILRVEIETTKEAKYVLVEIPIPAGCGYENETQEVRNNPNREYQRNKVNIFIENFGAGKRVYEIALLPRYTGVFTLNPTRVELMYFPTFFGRNTNQKVEIKETK